MLRAIYARPGERPVEVAGAAEVARLVRDGPGCLWVDIEQPGDEEHRLLREAFGFHELAVAGCVSRTKHARLNDYGDYLYLVFHAVDRVLPLGADEIDAFLGARYLVTYHPGRVAAIEEIRARALEVPAVMERGPDRILAELMDSVADGYITSMERLNAEIDGIEQGLFKRGAASALRNVFAMKKDVLHFRRMVSPLREVVNRLTRGEFKTISREEAVVFRDVHDHVYRVSEMLESFRDTLTSALEVYLTVVSNRTNEAVKVLTVFSIILMTLSFFAGVYGMNVPLPFAGRPWAVFAILAVMAGTALSLLLFFRNKKWI